MALTYDDLESNSFFHELQNTYSSKFKESQKNLWLICVPSQKSLEGITINREFVDTHVLKPSPFFKGQYLTTGSNNATSFEIENDFINTASGAVRILMEETAYNDDYKPYKILILERPLGISYKKSDDLCGNLCGNKEFPVSLNECVQVLGVCPEWTEILRMLKKKIHVFISCYVCLPEYLRDAASKLHRISVWAVNEFMNSSAVLSNRHSKAELAVAVENFMFFDFHDKVFPVIKKYCFEEDHLLNHKLLSLYEANITPDQLGVREVFCCQMPHAVVELASLNSRRSPSDKLTCLMATLELLNRDIENFLLETTVPMRYNKGIPCLTSDDLIPLLVFVIIQARPQYLASNLYYIQNFCWELSSLDKYSFGLVTFQAAKEFLKNNEFEFLKPSSKKVKKELSLEELMEVTVELQNSTKMCTEEKNAHSQTSIDFQLENVTKMIEASTVDLRERTNFKDSKSVRSKNLSETKHDENVGNFLSSLRQNSLGLTFGKLS